MTKSKAILIAYGLIGLANLIGHLLASNDITQYSKALLMPTLLLYLYESSKGAVTIKTLLVAGALIFSWGGDLVLINEENFLYGIGLFLIAQGIYVVTFRKAAYGKVYYSLRNLVPTILVGIALMAVLLPKAGDFSIPIVIYGLVILTMLVTALGRNGHTLNNSFKFTAYGAGLFVLSDSLIALNKFVVDIPVADFWVMMTYVSAQVLIVEGMIRHTD